MLRTPAPLIGALGVSNMVYATLRRRIGANLIDCLILGISMVLLRDVAGTNRWLATIAILVTGFSFYLYTLILHAVSGQTLGKRLLKIRVTTQQGRPITLRDSVRRNWLWFVTSFLWPVTTLLAISEMPPEMFQSQDTHAFFKMQLKLRPEWYSDASSALGVVIMIDAATAVLTKARQSLHDLAGGTVVIQVGEERNLPSLAEGRSP